MGPRYIGRLTHHPEECMIALLIPLVVSASPIVPGAVARRGGTEHGLEVRVDSSHHTVALTAGVYDLTAGGMDMPGMPMGMMQMDESRLLRFDWPVTGWIRGVRLRVFDQNGKELSHRLVHHINVINFARRQLFYPIPERILAMGQETQDIRVPATIGIPVTQGMPMALIVMWHNESPQAIKGVSVTMTVDYSPTNLVPRPVSVMPVYLDVMNPVGRDVDFDLPAGRGSWSKTFTLPVGGRIIGAGGHEHDFGTGVTLEDVSDSTHPRAVVHLNTKLDAKGELLSIDQLLPGISGSGIKLVAGRRYRLTGTYDNRTGKSIEKGAMIHMALLYVPDHPNQWPALDTTDADWKVDVARLVEMGELRAGESAPQKKTSM